MHSHLTQEQRYTLYEKKQEGFYQKEIAILVNVSPATISRELSHNSKGKYLPHIANQLAMERRGICRKPTVLTAEAKILIIHNLQKNWSPEQIAGRLKLEGILNISHETIYKYIYLRVETKTTWLFYKLC